MTSLRVSAFFAVLALAVSGCGGDEENDTSSSTAASTPEATAGGEAAGVTHAAVLECLKSAGLDAKDQSSSTGEKIGIDFPEGRVVISFEESAEDAETYASVAETNGELVRVQGNVVSSIPAGGAAESQQAAIEGCLGG